MARKGVSTKSKKVRRRLRETNISFEKARKKTRHLGSEIGFRSPKPGESGQHYQRDLYKHITDNWGKSEKTVQQFEAIIKNRLDYIKKQGYDLRANKNFVNFYGDVIKNMRANLEKKQRAVPALQKGVLKMGQRTEAAEKNLKETRLQMAKKQRAMRALQKGVVNMGQRTEASERRRAEEIAKLEEKNKKLSEEALSLRLDLEDQKRTGELKEETIKRLKQKSAELKSINERLTTDHKAEISNLRNQLRTADKKSRNVILGRINRLERSINELNRQGGYPSYPYSPGAVPASYAVRENPARQENRQEVRIEDSRRPGEGGVEVTEDILKVLRDGNIQLDPEQLEALTKAVAGKKGKGELAEALETLNNMEGLSRRDKRKIAMGILGEEKRPPMEGFAIGSRNLLSGLSFGASQVLIIIILILMMWIVLNFFPMI